MPSNHLFFCRPLFLLAPIPPSIRVFSNESSLHMRWPKYWSFSFSISPSNEHPGLIFTIDWLDLLAVQGTHKSLLQHHSSKASIFWCSAFFTVQLSHPYDHWKNHSLDFMANKWRDNGNKTDFIFLGSKITADGDCNHEIKSRSLLGRKVMTNLDSLLKRSDITLPTKVHLVKGLDAGKDPDAGKD